MATKRLKIEISPTLKKLDLVTKGLVNTKFMGNYASAFKGHGLEFASYRTYTQNDDASLIDWKASSRARKMLIKEFVEERNLNIVFVVDVSSKMMLGSTKKLKSEYAAELVASLSQTILQSGDAVGITMFSDKVVKNIKSSNGMKHFYNLSDALTNFSYYGGGSDLGGVLSFALKNFQQGSLIILVSDFIGDESFADELKFASQKFDLIGVMVRDPIDMKIPDAQGQVLVEDSGSGERFLFRPSEISKSYSRETRRQVSTLHKTFRSAGADFLELSTSRPFVEDLVAFFNRRKAEWK